MRWRRRMAGWIRVEGSSLADWKPPEVERREKARKRRELLGEPEWVIRTRERKRKWREANAERIRIYREREYARRRRLKEGNE